MEMALSRNLFTSSGDDLDTGGVPNCNRIDGAHVARAQQPFAVYLLGGEEYRCSAIVEYEGFRRPRDAVAESDAQRAIDAHPQLSDAAFLVVAHIPSSPSSARAVSMIAGVISLIPRSFA